MEGSEEPVAAPAQPGEVGTVLRCVLLQRARGSTPSVRLAWYAKAAIWRREPHDEDKIMERRMVEDNIVRLPPSRAMPVLKQKLNGYRSSCNRIYIGLTANPEARWERHQGDGWIKMAVLYEAYNVEIGQDLERELIDYARRCNFIEPPENIGSGGEGVLDQNGHHYLYVLVA